MNLGHHILYLSYLLAMTPRADRSSLPLLITVCLAELDN